MIENKETALKVAELLLQVKAVKLQPKNPFSWASGWKSPIYCDNRVTLSHPGVRTHIRQAFCENIILRFGKPDVIAGVATGGVSSMANLGNQQRGIDQQGLDATYQGLQRYASTIYGNPARQQATGGK